MCPYFKKIGLPTTKTKSELDKVKKRNKPALKNTKNIKTYMNLYHIQIWEVYNYRWSLVAVLHLQFEKHWSKASWSHITFEKMYLLFAIHNQYLLTLGAQSEILRPNFCFVKSKRTLQVKHLKRLKHNFRVYPVSLISVENRSRQWKVRLCFLKIKIISPLYRQRCDISYLH